MKTKALAVMAVMALAFAGVAVAFTEDADAVDPTYDLVITYDGYITDEDTINAIDDLGATVSYKAKLVDDLEDKITILNLTYYNAIEGAIDGDSVFFDNAALADANFKKGVKAFTEAEFNAAGKLTGGVATILTFADVLQADNFDAVFEVAVTSPADVEAAVAEAVAEALAEKDGYIYTQADIDAARAEVPAGYISQADADKAVADAVANATPKDDSTVWMALAIILGVVCVALGGLTVYGVVKKNKAKKAEKKEQA